VTRLSKKTKKTNFVKKKTNKFMYVPLDLAMVLGTSFQLSNEILTQIG